MDFSLVIDVVLGAIFIYCVYKGAKNGFLSSVASLLASVIALFAALFVVAQLTPIVSANYVNPWIETKLEKQLEENISESTLETMDSLIAITNKIFISIGDMLDSTEVSGTAHKSDKTDVRTTEELIASVASSIGNVVTAFLLFILIFAFFLAVLRVLIEKLSFINRIPIVGTANVLLGMALGIVTGIVFMIIPVWLLTSSIPNILGAEYVIDPQILENSRILAIVLKFYPINRI